MREIKINDIKITDKKETFLKFIIKILFSDPGMKLRKLRVERRASL